MPKVLFVLLLAGCLWRIGAQGLSGQVSGTVRDQAGAVVPRAVVAHRWFNTDAVRAPSAANYGIGNAPNTYLVGPGVDIWDLVLSKNFLFGPDGRHRILLCGEFYNAFNHAQYAGVDASARDAGWIRGSDRIKVRRVLLSVSSRPVVCARLRCILHELGRTSVTGRE